MSESTFLGTPLTKYDVDDFEIHAKSKRARSYLEAKELKRKQNREMIRKNKMKTLYTVDTEEGWTPSDFKSSRTKRAKYDFQTFNKFTDEDDSDIISMKVLNNLKMEERQKEISRIVKGILNNEGYLTKVIGPQLPAKNSYFLHVRDPMDLRGIGFTGSLEDENEEESESVKDKEDKRERKLKWISVDNKADEELFPKPVMDLGVKEEDLKRYHKFDRDIDLAEIKNYYKSYYDYIVKPIADMKEETEQELLEKYTKIPEFNKADASFSESTSESVKYKDSEKKEESREKFAHNFKGRTVSNYQFSKDLLNKFKIKPTFREKAEAPKRSSVTQSRDEVQKPVDLPQELFTNLFGKTN